MLEKNPKMLEKNPKIEEIFDPKKLSPRFYLYQRDSSRLRRSLYVNQMLMHIKHEFPEFKIPLDNAATKIKILGRADEVEIEKVITRSLRCGAAQIEEISEEAHLSWYEIRDKLHEMQNAGKVRKQKHPLSEDYQDEQWFLVNDGF